MKRFALTLMAVALTGAVAFADDMAPVAKLNGYVNTGVQMVATSSDTTFQAQAQDAGVSGYRSKITASQSAANYGVSVTVESNNGAFAIDGATGWVSPIAGLKVSGGTDYDDAVNALDDNGYGLGGNVGIDYSMSGFTVAATIAAPAAASHAPVAFGAKYDLPKVITLQGSGKLNSAQKFDEYSASFSLSAVENLSLKGGLWSTANAATAVTLADLTAGYTLDKLTVGFNSRYAVTDKALFTSATNGSKAGDFWFQPKASYGIADKVTLSGYFQYDMNANSNIEPQVEVSFALPNTTINVAGKYDTNPGHADTAVAATTAFVDLIYSF